MRTGLPSMYFPSLPSRRSRCGFHASAAAWNGQNHPGKGCTKYVPFANAYFIMSRRLHAKTLPTRFSSTPFLRRVSDQEVTRTRSYLTRMRGTSPLLCFVGGYSPWMMCCSDSIVRGMLVDLHLVRISSNVTSPRTASRALRFLDPLRLAGIRACSALSYVQTANPTHRSMYSRRKAWPYCKVDWLGISHAQYNVKKERTRRPMSVNSPSMLSSA